MDERSASRDFLDADGANRPLLITKVVPLPEAVPIVAKGIPN